MNEEKSPLATLSTWCTRHGVGVHPAVKAADVKGRGNGWLISHKEALSDAEEEEATLLRIPQNAILSAGYIEEFARQNVHFQRLLDAMPELRVSAGFARPPMP